MGWIWPTPATEEEAKRQDQQRMDIFWSGCGFYILFALIILINILMNW